METSLLVSNNFVNLKFEIILFKILREDYMSTRLHFVVAVVLAWFSWISVQIWGLPYLVDQY